LPPHITLYLLVIFKKIVYNHSVQTDCWCVKHCVSDWCWQHHSVLSLLLLAFIFRTGVCKQLWVNMQINIPLITTAVLYWIGLCSVLRPCQHSIGYVGDGFYRSKDPTNSIKVLKEMLQRTKKTTEGRDARPERWWGCRRGTRNSYMWIILNSDWYTHT